MNLHTYRQRRRDYENQAPTFRRLCMTCRQPDFSCYCAHLRPLDPKIRFVILSHSIEARKRIATGRMAHLNLQNSWLIEGHDFSHCDQVNEILANPRFYPIILYPGRNSTNLTPLTPEDRSRLFPIDRELVVFVIDGTWATARKMLRLSRNLQWLPRFGFSPPAPSRFRVRKQPGPACLSTIEAIHHTIELLGPSRRFDIAARAHDRLLTVFDILVEQQLAFLEDGRQRKMQQEINELWTLEDFAT